MRRWRRMDEDKKKRARRQFQLERKKSSVVVIRPALKLSLNCCWNYKQTLLNIPEGLTLSMYLLKRQI